MTKTFVRRMVAASAVASVAATLVVSSVAQAAADNGRITYALNSGTYIANADGSNPRLLSHDIQGAPTWAPDGSKMAYGSNLGGVYVANPDLSGARKVAYASAGGGLAWMPSGRYVVFGNGGQLWYAAADGDAPLVNEGLFQEGLNPDPSTITDNRPTFAPNSTLAFERRGGSAPGIYTLAPADTVPVRRIANGTQPTFSPDGTKLAYVVEDADENKVQIWVANADGSQAAALTSESTGATTPVWAPDGQSVLFRSSWAWSFSYDVKKIDVATKEVTTVVPRTEGNGGRNMSWQPIRKNYVDRVYGANAIQTGIAASQYNYRNNGDGNDLVRTQAKSVVLSRSDMFYDALTGSALAVAKDGPLLTTPTASLDAKVEAEIARVLGNTGQIYVLGSYDAVSKAISDKLTGIGYTVKRLAGGNMFETNVLINREITSNPRHVIVATGAQFYDALSAGAAANAYRDTVIVLTQGDRMPAASAQYLNALNPDPATGGVWLFTAGGAGDNALINGYQNNQMPNWPDMISRYPMVGTDAIDTSLQIAAMFFSGPQQAALATNASWYDALTGGAMVGANYGPLLLNPKSSLDGRVASYLSSNSNSIWAVQLLGSNASLADSLIAPAGNAISVPGNYIYTEFMAQTSTNIAGKSLKTPDGAGKRTIDGPNPGGAKPQFTTKEMEPIKKG